jgi:hypothetical protein
MKNFIILVLFVFSFCQGFSTRTSLVHRGKDISMTFNLNFGGPSIPSNKKLCVITGTTSGLGKSTVKAVLDNGNYYVICACRDVNKMQQVAEKEGFDKSKFTILELDLASFDSTRKFVAKLNNLKKGRPLDRLVCNAAVYQPALSTVR